MGIRFASCLTALLLASAAAQAQDDAPAEEEAGEQTANGDEEAGEQTPGDDEEAGEQTANGDQGGADESEGTATDDRRSSSEDAESAGEEAATGATELTPPYAVKAQNGIRLLLAKDLEAAAAAAREAIRLDPRRPQGHYVLGSVLRTKGDLQEALESFETAARMAGSDAGWRARAEAGAALVLEALATQQIRETEGEERPPEAPRVNEPVLERVRRAWERVREAGEDGARSADPDTVTARLQAIDAVIETDEKAAGVRTKIAEREKEKAEEEEE
ncbi:MAG: hypothetical protein ACODAU_00825 [Myxococcota bacterium]